MGAVFHGCFLHSDPLRIAHETYAERYDQIVVRLGLGRTGAGLLERCALQDGIRLNLHTVRMFDPDVDLEAGPYRLHTIQPSRKLDPDEALRLTAEW